MYQDARGSGCFGGMTPWRYPNYPPAGPEPAHAAPRRLRHHRSVALHRRLAGHYRRNPYLLRPHRLRPHRGFAPPALQRRSRGRRNTGPGAAMAAMAGPPQAGKRVDPTPMGALALRRSVTPPPSERSDEMRADEGREVGRGPDAEIPPAPFPKHERRRQFWLSPCGTDMHHARGSQSEKAAESSDLRWLASPAGFEPTAPGLGILCSILLSYGDYRSDSAHIAPRISCVTRRCERQPHCSQVRPVG